MKRNKEFIERVQEYINGAIEDFEFFASQNDIRNISKDVELSNNRRLSVMTMPKEGFSCIPDVVVTLEDFNTGDEDVIYSTSKYFDVTKNMEDIDDVIQ